MTTKPKILLVDDDPIIIENLSAYLQINGYDAIAARDGVSALDTLKEEKPKLMVLDVNLPKMSGVEVLKEMQRCEDKTPVIVMTAHGRDNDLDIIALNSGAIYYLDKPFRNPNLLVRINRALALLKESESELHNRNVLVWDSLRVNLDSCQVFRQDLPVKLAPKPFNLLAYLMTHPQQLLTRQQILQEVWGSIDFTPSVISKAKVNIITNLPELREVIEGKFGGYIFDAKVVRT